MPRTTRTSNKPARPPVEHILDSLLKCARITEHSDESSSPVDQIDEHLRALDETWRSLQDAMSNHVSQKRRERNQYRPLSQLPPELFIYILNLELCQSHDLTSSYWGKEMPKYYARLVDFMLVSKSWNGLIKNTPSFWSYVSIHCSPPLLSTIFKRSGTHRLKLYQQSGVYDNYDWSKFRADQASFARALAPHNHRLGKIIFTVMTDGMEAYRSYLESPGPLVDEIRISHAEPLGGLPYYVRIQQPEALKLRNLSLRHVVMDWSSLVFSGLTELSLALLHDQGPSIRRLMEILGACPKLKSLALLELPMDDDHSEEPFPVINLPHLQLFDVSGLHLHSLRKIITHIPALQSVSTLKISLAPPRQYFTEQNTSMPPPADHDFMKDMSAFLQRVFRSSPLVLTRGRPRCWLATEADRFSLLFSVQSGTEWTTRLGFTTPGGLREGFHYLRDALLACPVQVPVEVTLPGKIDWSDPRDTALFDGLRIGAFLLCPKSTAGYQSLLQYLSEPKVVDGVAKWNLEHLEKVELHEFDPSWPDVLRMIHRRYTADTGRASPQVRRPKVLEFNAKTLYVEPIYVDAIRRIIGEDKVVLPPDPPTPRTPSEADDSESESDVELEDEELEPVFGSDIEPDF